MELTGPPATVLEGVGGQVTSGVVYYSIAGDGTLAYRPASADLTDREYVWVDRDGREIFYTHGDRMMVVPVELEGGFSASNPRELFRFAFESLAGPYRAYDVTPDGQRFLMSRRPANEADRRRIDVIKNFAAALWKTAEESPPAGEPG